MNMKRLGSFVFNLILCLVTLELCSYLILLYFDQEQKSFVDIFYGENSNLFIRGKCDYVSSLQPHPYLGFVHKSDCYELNNVGLLGSDIEYTRKPGQVRIGIFGGSVAAEFAGFKENSALEHLLNHCYSNDGNVLYKVANFSDGAWKQPHQVIALSLFKQFVDIAITIEGFNEHYLYLSRFDFALPSDNFVEINPEMQRNYYLKKMYSSLYAIDGSLINNSNLIKLFVFTARTSLLRIFNRQSDSDWKLQWKLPAGINSAEWNQLRYAGFLRDFEAIAVAANIPSVFVLQPSPLYKKHLTDAERVAVTYDTYKREYEIISKVMHENTTNYLDLSALFSGEVKTVFGDSIHFTNFERPYSLGNKKMSEAIAGYLSSHGIINTTDQCPDDFDWE